MKRIFRQLICCFLIGLISNGVWAGGYYKLSDPKTYEVRLVWEFINQGDPAQNVKIRLQLPHREELPPYQKILSYSITPSGIKLKLTGDYAELVIPSITSRSSVKLECDYLVTNYAIGHDLDAYTGGRYVTDTRYLEPETGIESTAPMIVALARKITEGQDSNLDKAKTIFAYLNGHLEYRLVEEESHSALKTLNRGCGICTDYSFAYIALCRAVGIPARLIQGYRFDPAEITGREKELTSFSHAWAEIQLPKLGWITVDPTYSYLLNGVKEVNYDFFGKIMTKDRHLFFGYTLGESYSCVWKSDPRKPAKIEVKIAKYIRKIR